MSHIDYNSLKPYKETDPYPPNCMCVKDGYIIKNISGKTAYNGFRASDWKVVDVCPQRIDDSHQPVSKEQIKAWDLAERNAKEYSDKGIAQVIEEIESGAITPTNIIVENEAADTTCFPLFVTSATGDLGPKTNGAYSYNSATNTLTVSLVGDVVGNVTGTASGNLVSGGAIGTPSSGNLVNCTFPTLNQNTSGTASGLSAVSALPNGTTATTQPNGDGTTKLATNQYVDTGLAGKQDPLVSGTNIRTINSTSLLGSGDIAVQVTLVSGTNIKTINGVSVLGSGDMIIEGGGGGLTQQQVEGLI